MTTFPLRCKINCTKSDLFNKFNADSDKFNMFAVFSPILNNILKRPRIEMKIHSITDHFVSIRLDLIDVRWKMTNAILQDMKQAKWIHLSGNEK